MKVICITGTPGTGKTTLAKKLAKKLQFTYVDVHKIIVAKKLEDHYDKKRKCKVVDSAKLCKALLYLISKSESEGMPGLIIDSHLSHELPAEVVDACIVCKCNLKTLQKRLQKRKYSKAKIEENMQAEIFDICWLEAKEKTHKIIVFEKDFNSLIEKIRN